MSRAEFSGATSGFPVFINAMIILSATLVSILTVYRVASVSVNFLGQLSYRLRPPAWGTALGPLTSQLSPLL